MADRHASGACALLERAGSNPALGTGLFFYQPRWRNWYTLTLEVRMEQSVQVQVLSSALTLFNRSEQ